MEEQQGRQQEHVDFVVVGLHFHLYYPALSTFVTEQTIILHTNKLMRIPKFSSMIPLYLSYRLVFIHTNSMPSTRIMDTTYLTIRNLFPGDLTSKLI